MIFKLYTIFDKVAGDAGPIFCAVNSGVALRQAKAVLKEADNPDDYQLMLIGEYDSTAVMIDSISAEVITDETA